MNPRQIAEGFINLAKKKLGILPNEIKELAETRFAICLQCEDLDKEGKDCKLVGLTECCKHCGCYMPAKVKALEAVCGNKSNPKW